VAIGLSSGQLNTKQKVEDAGWIFESFDVGHIGANTLNSVGLLEKTIGSKVIQ